MTRIKINFCYISVVISIFCFCRTICAFKSPYYELPSKAIIPTKYHLHISTLIHQNIAAFNGSVSIDLIIREPTNEIVLHSNRLRQFNIVSINLESGLILKSPQLEYKLDEVREQLLINWPMFPLKLQIGQQYRLKIDFVGDIQEEQIFGLYKTTYLDENNNIFSIASTQFEPTGARVAFPCFDEPALKAKFVISIAHGTNYSAISNMPADGDPILSSTSNGEMATTKFMETPKMSTYLVAFAITNFNKNSIFVNGLEYRFFYPSNSKDNGSGALENAIKTVDVLEKLLDIKYTLPKLDQIQIKRLFPIAMENWGLLTFQQNIIVSNQNDNNIIDRLHMIKVQNHEIAHQWFGNLVTPASWKYCWLKEGMSTYFSYIAGHLVYPEEEFFEDFVVSEVPYLYTFPLNRPLTTDIPERSDIKDVMDIVPYKLGACFTRMFHHAIGQSTFMKGIFKYLSIYQYSVADENDFFSVMQAAVDEDKVHLFQNNQTVANVMHTWIHNIGIPTVQIIRNYETGTVTIRQKSNSKNKDEKWWIPMSFATAANPDFERTDADYIMPPQAEVTLDLKDLNISLSNSDWLIVNKQQTGIFSVVYDDFNLKLITEALIANRKTIHVFNRALIFRDISVNFDKELDAVEPLLGLLEYLKLEEESLPWFDAYDLIVKIYTKLEGTNTSAKFKNFIHDIIDKKYQSPFKNLTATDLKVKAKITELKYHVNTITCQNYTTEMAKEYFFSGIVVKDKPCKLSLCQAFQNTTFNEILEHKKRNIGEHVPANYELQTVLKCIKSEVFIEDKTDIFFGGPMWEAFLRKYEYSVWMWLTNNVAQDNEIKPPVIN